MGPNYFRGPGGTYMNAGQVGDWPTDSHGTSILSKISGKHFGASKKIKAVIVRHALVWTTSDVVEAVTWIINDWISIRSSISHTVKVAVINMSFHDQVGQHYKATSRADLVAFTRLRSLLNMAVAEGILPICSAGNDGQVSGFAQLQER